MYLGTETKRLLYLSHRQGKNYVANAFATWETQRQNFEPILIPFDYDRKRKTKPFESEMVTYKARNFSLHYTF